MADAKLSALTEETTPVDADLMYLVDDVAGTPTSKRITWANIKAAIRSALVSDTAYGSGWNGDTTTAPSKKAVYDEMELRLPAAWIVRKCKTADETVTNSTAIQDDNDLVFTIAANEVWVATWHLFVVAGDADPDIDITIVGPAGSTVKFGGHGLPTNFATVIGDVRVQGIGGGVELAFGATAAGTAINHIIVGGSCINGSTAGSVKLQWAQNVLDAGAGTTIQAGSFMVAERVS